MHYFCGVSRIDGHNARSSRTTAQSAAFCCGLAGLPAADLPLHLCGGTLALVFDVRADLSAHVDTTSETTLGSTYGARSRSWLRYENGALVAAALRAGDEHRVPAEAGLRLNAPAVVASLTGSGLAESPHLGVMPSGDGELVLQRPGARMARVIEHRLDGSVREFRVDAVGSQLTIGLPDRSADSELEWIEICLDSTGKG